MLSKQTNNKSTRESYLFMIDITLNCYPYIMKAVTTCQSNHTCLHKLMHVSAYMHNLVIVTNLMF